MSVIETRAVVAGSGTGPARSSKARVLAELQGRAKLGSGSGGGTVKRPSDEVEGLKFEVKWETSKGAFGVKMAGEDVRVEEGELSVVRHCFSSAWGWG